MADHAAKAALFDALAESAKALANGRRAELIDVLALGEYVDQLGATAPASSTTSRARSCPRCGGRCDGLPRSTSRDLSSWPRRTSATGRDSTR